MDIEAIKDILNKQEAKKYPHTKRVYNNALYLIKKLKINNKDARLLKYAALLHDIGYMEEFKITKPHAECSVNWCKNNRDKIDLDDSDFEIVCNIIKTHSSPEKCKTNLQKIFYDADKMDRYSMAEILRKSIILHLNKNIVEEEIAKLLIKKNTKLFFKESKDKVKTNWNSIIRLLKTILDQKEIKL